MLYSVGENGKDDRGRSRDDLRLPETLGDADDVALRTDPPLPRQP